MTPAPQQKYVISGLLSDTGTNGRDGHAIADAVVFLFPRDAVLKQPIAESKTSAQGAYAISAQEGEYVLEVMPPADAYAPTGYDYPFYHTAITVSQSFYVPTISLSMLSQHEQQWIAQTNADRAQYGVSSKLNADEFAMRAARNWANYLAEHPDATHFGPNAGETPQERYTLLGGIGRNGENVDFALNDAPWQGAEIMWLSESQYCPTPASFGCPPVVGGHETGHFLNIINPDAVWIGVGENLHGVPLAAGGVWSAFDAEYVAYP
jgi:uncharacterized protein YkwD